MDVWADQGLGSNLQVKGSNQSLPQAPLSAHLLWTRSGLPSHPCPILSRTPHGLPSKPLAWPVGLAACPLLTASPVSPAPSRPH